MSPLTGATADAGPCGETSGTVVKGVVLHVCSDGTVLFLVEKTVKKEAGGNRNFARPDTIIRISATGLRLADPEGVASDARGEP